jgi:hypothetical protein
MFPADDAKHSADEEPISLGRTFYPGVLAEKLTDPKDYLQRLSREVNFSSANHQD